MVSGGDRINPDQVHAEFAQAAQAIDSFAKQKPRFYERTKYLIVETTPEGPKLVCRTLNLREIWDAKRHPEKAAAKLTHVAHYLQGLQAKMASLPIRANQLGRGLQADEARMKAQFAATVEKFLDKQIKVEKLKVAELPAATKLVNCFQPGQLERSGARLVSLILVAGKNGKHDEAFELFQKLPKDQVKNVFVHKNEATMELLQRCVNLNLPLAEVVTHEQMVTLIGRAGEERKYDQAFLLFKQLPVGKWADALQKVKHGRGELVARLLQDAAVQESFKPVLAAVISAQQKAGADLSDVVDALSSNVAPRNAFMLDLLERATPGGAKAADPAIAAFIQSSEIMKACVNDAFVQVLVQRKGENLSLVIDRFKEVIATFSDQQKYDVIGSAIQARNSGNASNLIDVCFGAVGSALSDTQVRVVGLLAGFADGPVRDALAQRFPTDKLSLVRDNDAARVAITKHAVAKGAAEISKLLVHVPDVEARFQYCKLLADKAPDALKAIVRTLTPTQKGEIAGYIHDQYAPYEKVWLRRQVEDDRGWGRSFQIPQYVREQRAREDAVMQVLENMARYFG